MELQTAVLKTIGANAVSFGTGKPLQPGSKAKRFFQESDIGGFILTFFV